MRSNILLISDLNPAEIEQEKETERMSLAFIASLARYSWMHLKNI
jgi:hypothetical protein